MKMTGRHTIEETENDNRINALFRELVPAEGKADSLAGELVRATARIGYRWINDGDRIGEGYGRETCNPAARFLIRKTHETAIAAIVGDLWSNWKTDAEYTDRIDDLAGAVADYIEAHPETRTTETEDLFDFFDPQEDKDDTEDEEDYYEDED